MRMPRFQPPWPLARLNLVETRPAPARSAQRAAPRRDRHNPAARLGRNPLCSQAANMPSPLPLRAADATPTAFARSPPDRAREAPALPRDPIDFGPHGDEPPGRKSVLSPCTTPHLRRWAGQPRLAAGSPDASDHGLQPCRTKAHALRARRAHLGATPLIGGGPVVFVYGLQRGRAQPSAEMTPEDLSAAIMTTLQWGRARPSAETTHSHLTFPVVLHASMGLHPLGRGDSSGSMASSGIRV